MTRVDEVMPDLRIPDPMLPSWEGESVETWASRLGVPNVEFYERIDSTNRRGRELAVAGPALPVVIVAERQTAGRGRRGREWISDTPEGLWCTVVLEVSPVAPLTPLLAGLALARAAEAQINGGDAFPRLGIKWPNDVLSSGKKVAGVLCATVDGRVVVGMGINVNHDSGTLPKEVGYPVTSLKLEAGRPLERGRLLVRVVQELRVLLGGGEPAQTDALAEVNARSTVRGVPLAICGTVRHSSGALEVVEQSTATGGRVLPDGSLELLCSGSESMTLVAGSVMHTGDVATT